MTAIYRDYHRLPDLTLCNGSGNIADATAIDMRDWALGILLMGDTHTLTSVTPYVCDTETGTYIALLDKNGDAVSMPVSAATAIAIELPGPVFSAHWMKFVGNAEFTAGVLMLKG